METVQGCRWSSILEPNLGVAALYLEPIAKPLDNQRLAARTRVSSAGQFPHKACYCTYTQQGGTTLDRGVVTGAMEPNLAPGGLQKTPSQIVNKTISLACN